MTKSKVVAPKPIKRIIPKSVLYWAPDANLSGKALTWEAAQIFITSLNKKKYLGFNDWRLPTIKELVTLVDYSKKDQEDNLNSYGFTNVRSDYYWSSSTYADNPSYAWVVVMSVGYVGDYDRSHSSYVWPVRAGQ